jgi:hypothetical protein
MHSPSPSPTHLKPVAPLSPNSQDSSDEIQPTVEYTLSDPTSSTTDDNGIELLSPPSPSSSKLITTPSATPLKRKRPSSSSRPVKIWKREIVNIPQKLLTSSSENGASDQNIQEEDEEDEEDSWHDDICFKCGKEGNLYLCDGCVHAFHANCVRPVLLDRALEEDKKNFGIDFSHAPSTSSSLLQMPYDELRTKFLDSKKSLVYRSRSQMCHS